MEMVDLNLDVALKILKAAGHQIGDAYIPPAPHGDAMRIWIDGVSCTLGDVLKMALLEFDGKIAKEEIEEFEQPG
jgi:hypothetical protein